MALVGEAAFDARLKAEGLMRRARQERARGQVAHVGRVCVRLELRAAAGRRLVVRHRGVLAVLSDADHVKRSASRRVFFEAYTAIAADFKRRLVWTDGEPPRKLPLAERSARVKALQERLRGLKPQASWSVPRPCGQGRAVVHGRRPLVYPVGGLHHALAEAGGPARAQGVPAQ